MQGALKLVSYLIASHVQGLVRQESVFSLRRSQSHVYAAKKDSDLSITALALLGSGLGIQKTIHIHQKNPQIYSYLTCPANSDQIETTGWIFVHVI